MNRNALILSAAVGIAAVTGCGSTGAPSAASSSSASGLATPPPNPSASAAAKACENRVATPQILVWYKVPGLADSAAEYGGEWNIDSENGKCLDSTELTLATSPTGPGYCTEVEWADSQPNYNVDADPAPPLKDVVEEVGPAC
jgi:hypothetical protein